MEMVNVTSSNISAIGYDPNTGLLRIEFRKGEAYEYYDVPQYEHDGLMNAPSHGTYANRNIYRKYRQHRIS